MSDSRWLRFAVAFAAWTLVGVVLASQGFIAAAYLQRPPTWSEAFAVGLGGWYVRAALSPIVVAIARRMPIARALLARRVLTHVAIGIAWSVVATVAIQLVTTRVLGGSRMPSSVELYTSLLTYAALVGFTQAADHLRQRRDAEITALRLEARLAAAHLDLLRMQLNPQFLASSLHGIAEVMHRDVARAMRMAEELAELIRLASRHGGESDVPLSEEVGFLRRYLHLEQMRFQDRLETHVDIESDAMSARVPYMILQPLVENAVRHGAAPHVGRGRIEVRGRADGEALVLEVYDEAVGAGSRINEERAEPGLRSTRERLRESYGESHRLEMAEVVGGGLCVRLELPLRRPVTGSPHVSTTAHQ